MIEYKYNDDDPCDRAIEVYRDGELISGLFYEMNDTNSMIELVSLLNRLTNECEKEIL